jgi:hypothetical protein
VIYCPGIIRNLNYQTRLRTEQWDLFGVYLRKVIIIRCWKIDAMLIFSILCTEGFDDIIKNEISNFLFTLYIILQTLKLHNGRA